MAVKRVQARVDAIECEKMKKVGFEKKEQCESAEYSSPSTPYKLIAVLF